MATQLYRIQADRDPATGKVERVTILDEIVATDPVSGETLGTGRLVEPHRTLTRADRPALFVELDQLAEEAEARTADKAVEHAERKARIEAERKAHIEAERQAKPEKQPKD